METEARRRKPLLIFVFACALVALAFLVPGRLPRVVGQTVPPPPPSGSFLSFVSQPGDPIGGGQSLTFTKDTAGFLAFASPDLRIFHAQVFQGGSHAFLDLAAPAGQTVTAGVYEGARAYPFQAPTQPGIDFSAGGSFCTALSGRFQVFEAAYGPRGYVTRFHATFSLQCDGASAGLSGEIQIVNPPPPPLLAITITLDKRDPVNEDDGAIVVSGTITCTNSATVNFFGTITQRTSRTALSDASFFGPLQCSPTAVRWSFSRTASNGPPFGEGSAAIDVIANAQDPFYGGFVSTETIATVRIFEVDH